MNRTTKGALAAAAAAVLLLGGTGTLAYWSDSASVNGGDINTGRLDLTAGSCAGDWVYEGGDDDGGTVGEIVPGDAIAKECTFTIGAEGDHLEAQPTTPATVTYTTTGSPTTLTLPVSATYELDGSPLTGNVTEADDGDTLTARIVVTFPFGTATTVNANDTQDLTVTLDDLTVSLTQMSTGENSNP